MPLNFIQKIILLSFLIPSVALAEVYNIIIKSDFLPTEASGIILDSGELTEIEVLSIAELENSFIKIEFEGPDEKLAALVSFNLKGAEGQNFLTSFKQIDPKLNQENLTATAGACQEYTPPESVYRNAFVIERLVDLRKQRLENRKIEITRILSLDKVSQLKKIEAGLGLKYPDELSADLPLEVLADRLSTIRSLLISYKMQQINK